MGANRVGTLACDNKRKFTLGVLGFVARMVEVLGALETSEWCSGISGGDNSLGSVTRASVTIGNLTPGIMGLPGWTPAQGNQEKGPQVTAGALSCEYWSEHIRTQFCGNQAGATGGLGQGWAILGPVT